jgi:hypothetical protein
MTKSEDIVSAETDCFVIITSSLLRYSLFVIRHRTTILWRDP